MRHRTAAVLAAVLLTVGLLAPSAGATRPRSPGPARHECIGPKQATVTMSDAWTPWMHSYWHLNFQWCTTGILWGRVYGELHWQTTSSLDGLLETKDIVENHSSYYTYRGIANAGRRIHVKGHIQNKFFGWSCDLYPSANVWVHADLTYHYSVGLDDCA